MNGARASVHVALALAFGVLALSQGWLGQFRAKVQSVTGGATSVPTSASGFAPGASAGTPAQGAQAGAGGGGGGSSW